MAQRRPVLLLVLAAAIVAFLVGVSLTLLPVPATAHHVTQPPPGMTAQKARASVGHVPSPRTTLVVGTYNIDSAAPSAGSLTDLRALLARTDVLVVQEVTAAKRAVIARVRTGIRVLYSPGRAEAVIWHPGRVLCRGQGVTLLSKRTRVGPSETVPAKYLVWSRFQLRHTSSSVQVGDLQLVPKSHVAHRRGALLKLEVRNLAHALARLKNPLIGGDWNLNYNDPSLASLHRIGMLNNQDALGWVPTFYNRSNGAPRSFDQWWFHPTPQNGLRLLREQTFKGSSDHLALIVSFGVKS